MAVTISGTGLDASTIVSGSITQDKIATGAITDTKMATGAAVSNIGYTPVNSSFLVGQIGYFAMSTAPDGWLKANGQEVSRTTYSALFAVIETTYGTGNGSTTFNVPDLRGEFLRSLDDGRGVDAGRTLGSAQADEVKGHKHAGAVPNGSQWYQVYSSTNHTTGWPSESGPGAFNDRYTGATGGTETRPRNLALLACIKY